MNTLFSFDPNTNFLDITAPKHVEITIRDDKTVLWVNVDGVCALRICRIESIEHNIPQQLMADKKS